MARDFRQTIKETDTILTLDFSERREFQLYTEIEDIIKKKFPVETEGKEMVGCVAGNEYEGPDKTCWRKIA
ncbi:hypothetical protein LCGC14_0415590 [marine sediment metagenome]|uniref:Uncharacterized protein n=1 Tax=marine sediment metagenome TaxID=412755 RepID=A0A0F9W1I7_9ZZZZ